jgi:hypothetical protein
MGGSEPNKCGSNCSRLLYPFLSSWAVFSWSQRQEWSRRLNSQQRFKAESTARTFAGKLKVAVTLGGASKGIKVKDSEPKNYMAEATILEP